MVLVEHLLLIRLGGLRPDRKVLVHSLDHFEAFPGEVLLLKGIGQEVIEFPRFGIVFLGRYADDICRAPHPRWRLICGV